jgi:hypothetical protein
MLATAKGPAARTSRSACWKFLLSWRSALPNKFTVHSNEDPLFPFAQSRIGLGRLDHAHDRFMTALTVWHVAKQSGERAGLQPQGAFKRCNAIRPRRRAAKEPLRHRCLRHLDHRGETTLRQPKVSAGTLERLPKHLTLFGRRQRRDPRLSAMTSNDKHASSLEQRSTVASGDNRRLSYDHYSLILVQRSSGRSNGSARPRSMGEAA